MQTGLLITTLCNLIKISAITHIITKYVSTSQTDITTEMIEQSSLTGAQQYMLWIWLACYVFIIVTNLTMCQTNAHHIENTNDGIKAMTLYMFVLGFFIYFDITIPIDPFKNLMKYLFLIDVLSMMACIFFSGILNYNIMVYVLLGSIYIISMLILAILRGFSNDIIHLCSSCYTDSELCNVLYNQSRQNAIAIQIKCPTCQYNAICSICLNAVISPKHTGKQSFKRLRCQHNFHNKCINRWLREHNTCPLCRIIVT